MVQATVQNLLYSMPIRRFQHNARTWMGVSLLLADVATFLFAGSIAWAVTHWTRGAIGLSGVEIVFVSLSCLFAFQMYGLYHPIALSLITELRRLTITTSFIVLTFSAFVSLSVMSSNRHVWGELTLWLLAIILLPGMRFLMRSVLIHMNRWGEPVAIINFNGNATRLYEMLMKKKMLGIVPALVINVGTTSLQCDLPTVALGDLAFDGEGLGDQNIQTALLVSQKLPPDVVQQVSVIQLKYFPQIILVPEMQELISLGVTPVFLNGIYGMEISHNLRSASKQIAKRLIDLMIVTVSAPLWLPVIGLLAVLVRLTSPGPSFYRHTRIGRGGRKFDVWKFRTMVQDAEALFEKFLAENPDQKVEWETTQKLRNDPRITKLGRFLRRNSLDELPQLLNIFWGEMSLVGPRPCTPDQIQFYNHVFLLYKEVTPGLSGLWQVSGRNKLAYTERVRLDEIYIRNWSIWMDIYILIKTIPVVTRNDGAY